MLHPLRFRPLFKHYLWGGHQLRQRFRKPVPEDQTCAESWELVDRRAPDSGQQHEQSVVAHGPLAGKSLAELVDVHPAELLGRHAPQSRFPLLVKLLDADQALSVQVHPNDQQAGQLSTPDLGKTEAWVVLHAQPGARLYAGLKPGVDRDTLRAAIHSGTCEQCLHVLEPQPGDCIFIPAGIVHALGQGLLIAEIQQSSDVTYRLFDWNRVGPDGQPRELHVDAALDVIDFAAGPVAPVTPQPTEQAGVERLVACDKFVIDRWTLTAPGAIGGDRRAHIVLVLEGAVQVEHDPAGEPLRAGETMLIPASIPPARVAPLERAVLLDAYLP